MRMFMSTADIVLYYFFALIVMNLDSHVYVYTLGW